MTLDEAMACSVSFLQSILAKCDFLYYLSYVK